MDAGSSSRNNLLVVVAVIFMAAFTARQEGYIPLISALFSVVLAGAACVSIWLAFNIATKRLVALVFVVIVMEYLNQTIANNTGLWTYARPSLMFSVWIWVLASMTSFALARLVVTPILARIETPIPRSFNTILIVGLAGVGLLLMGPSRPQASLEFWILYSLLFAVAVYASFKMEFSIFAALAIVAIAVGIPSEYFGSTGNGSWSFPFDPDFPPWYLVLACWPLEIVAQYFLSGLLVGEIPVGESTNRPEPIDRHDALKVTLKKHPAISEVPLSSKEKHLGLVMKISGWTYLVVGFAFAIIPDRLMEFINQLSLWLLPSLPTTEPSLEKFWLAMTFSMMMTIAAACFMAAHNIRKNKGFVIPLLISKSASALCSLVFFLWSTKYLAYLVIFVVDGSIFWFTLYFYLRANRAFFEAQTAYLRERPKVLKKGPKTRVVSLTNSDRFKLLKDTLDQAGFDDVLNRKFQEFGNQMADFAVVIKPNFMFMHSLDDPSTYTDPELVEALVDRIEALGFTNITLVEAQSTYGNYYTNREVLTVAEYIGYSTERNYRLVDLTLEKEEYDYGGRLGKHFVGPTWRDADFRISFAKNKTHVFCNYTLTLKNIYGTLPLQNKLKEYHTKREYDWPTIETLKHFEVHFGIIDAFLSADGQFGVITDPTPRHTETIIAGENLLAVDWVGATKMGLDPDDPQVGRFLPLAQEAFGRPEIIWVGEQAVYHPWDNVSNVIIQSLDLIEEAYHFANWWFETLTAMDKFFKLKKRKWGVYLLRFILAPFKRMLYPHDKLP